MNDFTPPARAAGVPPLPPGWQPATPPTTWAPPQPQPVWAPPQPTQTTWTPPQTSRTPQGPQASRAAGGGAHRWSSGGGRHRAPSPHRPSPGVAAKSAKGVLTDASKILSNLQKGARLAPTLYAGVAIAATAAANVPGMADVYNNWESLHSRLDTAVKSYSAALLTAGAGGWIAEDRDAYEDAVRRFQEGLESMRGYVKTIAGIVDEVGDAYRAYWVAIARLAATFLLLATVAAAMLLTPWAGSAALHLRMLGALATQIISVSTGALWKLIEMVAGGFAVYFGGKAIFQMYNLEPTGAARIDFTQAEIRIGDLPSFQKPPPSSSGNAPQPPPPSAGGVPGLPVPPGGTVPGGASQSPPAGNVPGLPPSAGFQWLSPRQEIPEPAR